YASWRFIQRKFLRFLGTSFDHIAFHIFLSGGRVPFNSLAACLVLFRFIVVFALLGHFFSFLIPLYRSACFITDNFAPRRSKPSVILRFSSSSCGIWAPRPASLSASSFPLSLSCPFIHWIMVGLVLHLIQPVIVFN